MDSTCTTRPAPLAHSMIALIGPMGAGKSSVGRLLARLLKRSFVDLDHAIQHHAGADIPLIFDMEGEAGFRRREHEALLRELDQPSLVLACGGGVILDARNRSELKSRALVIYLAASVDEQLQRLNRDRSRPLLQTPDRRACLEALARQRNPLYTEVADLSLRTGGRQPAQVASQIVELLTTSASAATPVPFSALEST